MKEVEYKLISELAKNSRRSDRQLAEAIGSSQPTVTRALHRLKEKKVIKEFTIVPDFDQLGYEILAFTFLKFDRHILQDEYLKIRDKVIEREKESTSSAIMVLNGAGMGSDRLIVSYHQNYTTFLEHLQRMKQLSDYHITYVDSFIVSVKDKTNARPLSLSVLAEKIPRLMKTLQS